MDFQELFLSFCKEEDEKILQTLASCIHVPLEIAKQEEDTMKLRKAVNILLKNTNKDIMVRVNKNLSTIIKYYSNEHAVKNYAEKGIRSDGGEDAVKGNNSEETTPITG